MKPEREAILTILLIFCLTQLIGVYAGVQIFNVTQTNPELEKTFNVSPAPKSDISNTFFYLGAVLLGAVVMVLTIKFYKGKFMFKFLELIIVGNGAAVVGFAVLLFFFSLEFAIGGGILIGIVAALIRFSREEKIVRNTAAILASAGIGAMFGYSLGFVPAVLFAVALSFYDFFAVFIAKHMITFAQHFSAKNLSFSVVAASGKDKKIEIPVEKAKSMGMQVTDDEMKSGKKKIETKQVHLELGTGDLVIPLVLAVSALPVYGLLGSYMIIMSSLVGLLFVLSEVMKKKRFLPALPYLIIPCLIMIFILHLLQNKGF
ncbi:hypothetical protein KO465_09650 [Candidatus Micrarchaeota archaeon]|jgi:presenilin-like A22 family membrane protease|nr:hypothetical protein [Candidatus Micrarchaeota archaeon]